MADETLPAPKSGEPTAAAPTHSLKGALVLMVAQVVATPLSFIINVAMARYLGADEFGLMYLVGTFCGFAFLVVEWGLGSTVTAGVAKDRSQAGRLLGSGLVWRLCATPVIYAVLAGVCALLGYGRDFQIALALMTLVFVLYTTSSAFQEVIRGFERMEVPAYAIVGQQLLNLLIVVPVLVLGGRLPALLFAQAATGLVLIAYLWRALRSMGKISISFRLETAKKLLSSGVPFLAFNLALQLQPNIDALLLSKMAPVDTVGWLAAAKKLLGVLIFPATALTSAFYPTWSRLWVEDREAFRRSVGIGLRTSTVLVVPLALGCAIYPEVGINAFSHQAFGAAVDDLRLLSLYVLLLYFSIILGTAIIATGASRGWAICQFGCVIVSGIVDPLLIPYCQGRYGNGGLGVCVSTVLSETLMVAGGLWLAPRGILDRALCRTVGLSFLAGVAMFGASRIFSGITPYLAAPASVIVYGACLWATGGVDPVVASTLRDTVKHKLARRAGGKGR